MDWTQRRAQSLSRASGESGRGRELTGGHEKVSASDFKQYSAKQTRSYTKQHISCARNLYAMESGNMIQKTLFVKAVIATGVFPR